MSQINAVQLSAEQDAAVEAILDNVEVYGNRYSLLSGPAGSGKTTLIRKLYEKLTDCVVVTPTNKAAFVLKSKGLPAQTIHSLFFCLLGHGVEIRGTYYPKKSFIDAITYRDHYDKLPAGKITHVTTIIIDEASMVPYWILKKLEAMCHHLILVGDGDQLPPVGDKRYPLGFFNSIPKTAHLTTIHRQEGDSPILKLATALRAGDPSVEGLVREIGNFDVSFSDAVLQGYKFIAFTNKERARINYLARAVLGRGSLMPLPGDQVISTSNYSELLLNGTEATVVSFHWDGQTEVGKVQLLLDNGVTVSHDMAMRAFITDQIVGPYSEFSHALHRMDNRPVDDAGCELTYAYCITAHKSQGSEYERVAVIDQRNIVKSVAANTDGMGPDEYARRWMYTAITRAKDQLLIAPQWWAVAAPQGVAA